MCAYNCDVFFHTPIIELKSQLLPHLKALISLASPLQTGGHAICIPAFIKNPRQNLSYFIEDVLFKLQIKSGWFCR
jgi:hypothetical protein